VRLGIGLPKIDVCGGELAGAFRRVTWFVLGGYGKRHVLYVKPDIGGQAVFQQVLIWVESSLGVHEHSRVHRAHFPLYLVP
jgi:hypothetical protein